MRPLLSAVGEAVGQAHSLPSQQAVRTQLGVQRGVEHANRGLSHQEAAPKQVEIIQRHQETLWSTKRRMWSYGGRRQRERMWEKCFRFTVKEIYKKSCD